MTAHISVRLFWHDSGWNGAICRDPAGNVWCEAHEHVRDNKDPGEAANAGRAVDEATVMPGCEMSIQAFSRRSGTIRVWPPDWMRTQDVEPADLHVEPMSSGMWPYENMWDAEGRHRPNEERRAVVDEFLAEVQPGKTLVFFYVDERNPLFIDDGERSPHRLLVGISRLAEVGQIQEWAQSTRDGATNMVWSLPFRHAYPDDGIRLPVQALVARVPDIERRGTYSVPLDGGLRTDFRYGSSRVSLDRAVAVVERAINALGRVKADNVLGTAVDAELAWLNGVLLELWQDRGPYPGLAPVLAALGCGRAMEMQRTVVPDLLNRGTDPADAIFAHLEGEELPEAVPFADELEDAAFEWEAMSTDDRMLARLLVRMELTADQVVGVLQSANRGKHRLPLDASEILANPYLICERFAPLSGREPISFLTVDHALLPHESVPAPAIGRIGKRDPRRLRALLTTVLRDRGADGDTFVDADGACGAAADLSPEDRPCDVSADRLGTARYAEVVDQTIERFSVEDKPYVALRELRRHELRIEQVLHDLAGRPRLAARETEWQTIVDDLSETKGGARLRLSGEQREALDRSLRSPVSIITGAAGTGKSTLLAPLIAAIGRDEGNVPIRALAPTGKAADRLKELGVEAMTIHRALASAGWYDWDLGAWRESCDGRIAANTLIIDESSMVDVVLLGTLFDAVDWHSVRRLVLVGDHHQLPPIGPGRPFFDLIARMKAADESPETDPYADRLNELTHNYRVAEGSKAIALANSFAMQHEPDDALIWTALAKGEDQGDLRVRFWRDPEELHRLLLDEIESMVDRECTGAGMDPPPQYPFDATIGHDDRFDASHWQILVPVRGDAHGTRKLNAIIQDRYHAWAKRGKRYPNGAIERWPVKFGDEQITSLDKVMQISNERLPAYDRSAGGGQKKERHPVFNGQIGTVRREYPRAVHRFRKGEKGQVQSISVEFDGLPGLVFDYGSKGSRSVDRNLELAYAITVHKGQGSQFRHVIFVLPTAAASFFGRELTYTGLTRAKDSLTLLLERDIGTLLTLSKHAAAKTPQRNSRLFVARTGSIGSRSDALVHVTTRGDHVASKSEVVIGNLLHQYERAGELSYEYEKELHAPGGEEWNFRLPDFTVHARGKTFYWEHCGMYGDAAYRQKWDEVRQPWYTRHGFDDQLIVTYEGDEPGLRSDQLEQAVILERILGR